MSLALNADGHDVARVVDNLALNVRMDAAHRRDSLVEWRVHLTVA